MHIAGVATAVCMALIVFTGVANSQLRVAVEVSPATDSRADMLSAVTFGTALAAWVSENEPENIRVGVYRPSAEALVGAMTSQTNIWRQMGDAPRHRYLEDLVSVADAGFLEEYVSHYYLGAAASGQPSEERMALFLEWASANLSNHIPRVEARLVFSKE